MKFTIRALLAFTAMMALACAAFFVFPDGIAAICLIALNTIIPAALLAAAIYGRGSLRAFSIGALFPLLGMSWYGSILFIDSINFGSASSVTFPNEVWEALVNSADDWKSATAVIWPTIVLSGLTTLGVRRLVQQKA